MLSNKNLLPNFVLLGDMGALPSLPQGLSLTVSLSASPHCLSQGRGRYSPLILGILFELLPPPAPLLHKACHAYMIRIKRKEGERGRRREEGQAGG